jgi:thioredoxin-like negative regulator of GroEL
MSLKKLGRTDEALITLSQGLEAVGDDPEIRFQTALLLTELGRLEEAKEQYLTIKDDVSGHFSSIDIGILGFKRHHNLASVCFGLGNYEEARNWWLKALETAPDFLPSAFELFDAALACRDFESAKLCLDRIQAAEGFGPNWLKMAEKYGSSAGGPGYSEFLVRQAFERNHRNVEAGLSLARILLGQERVSEAAPLLRELERVGSAEAAYYLGVAEIREGRYRSALALMERALELNPGHEETRQQVHNLKRALV